LQDNRTGALITATDLVQAPLTHKGKVRELYDLGDHWLIVVTDRISAFDYVLTPAVPGKGRVLNRLSLHWFRLTEPIVENHVVHADVDRLGDVVTDREALRDRIMVVRKARRIDMECIVRGYITGGGWRQYQKTGAVNGIVLPAGLRKNERLEAPIFTPAAKNDAGHDEDISFERMQALIGAELAEQLRAYSLELYRFAAAYCDRRGIILVDSKFEFGIADGKVILIDELFTPDSSRYWAKEKFQLDTEIESMDKEPVRAYLLESGWDRESPPDPLPDEVVAETTRRYEEIERRLTDAAHD
jgi:phosphoribosylaminoimidazole-succinocarboxamide synthase